MTLPRCPTARFSNGSAAHPARENGGRNPVLTGICISRFGADRQTLFGLMGLSRIGEYRAPDDPRRILLSLYFRNEVKPYAASALEKLTDIHGRMKDAGGEFLFPFSRVSPHGGE